MPARALRLSEGQADRIVRAARSSFTTDGSEAGHLRSEGSRPSLQEAEQEVSQVRSVLALTSEAFQLYRVCRLPRSPSVRC